MFIIIKKTEIKIVHFFFCARLPFIKFLWFWLHLIQYKSRSHPFLSILQNSGFGNGGNNNSLTKGMELLMNDSGQINMVIFLGEKNLVYNDKKFLKMIIWKLHRFSPQFFVKISCSSQCILAGNLVSFLYKEWKGLFFLELRRANLRNSSHLLLCFYYRNHSSFTLEGLNESFI